MSEITEDGFWQMVEGEWVPTEKQLEAIQNGAIGHDDEIVQQEEKVILAGEIKTMWSLATDIAKTNGDLSIYQIRLSNRCF